ncbi:expressed unknown protein [Seminavis robusta]|uniref:Uncharacterized protein n=1 Tax=Seminavis robusta TaxID=568900 RepID=A0A9N8H6Z3_9STRA|nr:expressed unknown protein [Seminavis robusta]|eukprot:Sro114_g056330.1 n/a (325) ;mRNA; r:38430-39404
MYQEDMIDEDDGCGGQEPRRRRNHPQIKHIRPRVNKPSSVDDYLKRQDGRQRHSTGSEILWELNHHYEFEEKKLQLKQEEEEKQPPEAQRLDKEVVIAAPPTQQESGPINDDNPKITVGKAIPWKKNSSRTIARGGASSYYGVYVHEVHLTATSIWVQVMALGEWNLPSPKSSLFCVIAEGESWDQLAEEEHALSKEHKYYPSRFDRAQWQPSSSSSSKTTKQGSYEGTLVLPRTFLETSLKQQADKATLCMRYAATAPWHDDYAVIQLLEWKTLSTSTCSSGHHHKTYSCPRKKHPVPVQEAWRAIFPQEVLERFRAREVKKI